MEYDFHSGDIVPGGKSRTVSDRFHRVRALFREGFSAIRRMPYFFQDAAAIYRRDPVLSGRLTGVFEIILYASFWAMLSYRLAHVFQSFRLRFIARLVSQLARLFTGIEIHPGARIGPGLFIDHGMGTVIGGTAVIGKNVLLFHGVTLGGVSAAPGRRHPMLGDDVLVGAGAAVLGAITIGSGSRIGAQAVVLTDVPENATAVGIPARVIEHREQTPHTVACCGGEHR